MKRKHFSQPISDNNVAILTKNVLEYTLVFKLNFRNLNKN